MKPMIQRRQGVTLSTNRYGPDAVVQRVESLAQCFEEMSVQRPAHKVTEARLEEWRKQLRRLSQQKVTQADSQTIINAIRTWKELWLITRRTGALKWSRTWTWHHSFRRARMAQRGPWHR